jgi:hypothetical protein
MDLNAYAFISYQTDDKKVARHIKEILLEVGIKSFLAHEDITVSEEWRLKILEEIGKADIFICLLSRSYLKSPWCIQETGIAAFRDKMTVIPLSLDGTVPQGFIANIQSVKVDLTALTIRDLIPGLLKHDLSKGIDLIIEIIGGSSSFRGAEANFALILPYADKLTNKQARRLLGQAVANNQVHHAGLCAGDYIPPLLERYGHLLNPEDLRFLKRICKEWA